MQHFNKRAVNQLKLAKLIACEMIPQNNIGMTVQQNRYALASQDLTMFGTPF